MSTRAQSEGISSPRAQSVSLALRRSALRYPDKDALIFEEECWSYAQFDAIVDRLAGGLIARGIGKGDRVAIVARNSNAFLAIRFAVARIAAVLVPVNVMLSRDDIAYILEHAGVSFLFTDAEFLDLVKDASVPSVREIVVVGGQRDGHVGWKDIGDTAAEPIDLADADDLLQIVYTSGTEGRPKGAMLTHSAVQWQYHSCMIDCEWTSHDVTLHAMPLFHCGALDFMAGPAVAIGATAVIISRPTAVEICRAIERHKVTSLFGPATMWIAILESEASHHHDISSLSDCLYGASIMPTPILEQLWARLPLLRLWNVYGQTEMAPLAIVLRPEEHRTRLGATGRATLHAQARVVDDAMHDVAPGGEIGEIVLRSPQLLTGYWRQEEATAKAFEGGWFHSGDLATIDGDGYITVVDRKKDMIKSGGENISSREVEEAIYTHPKVSEVAVVGLPHPRWIEAVTAFIVLKEQQTATPDEILGHCAAHLAGFKVPKAVTFVEALPKNASGKILKRDLRQQAR